jgi:hypothetical protein
MDECLYQVELTDFSSLSSSSQNHATVALERGQVVYLPKVVFALHPEEEALLTTSILSSGHKNISFDVQKQRISGLDDLQQRDLAHAMMQRYTAFSRELIAGLFPAYADAIRWGRTSYRPAEIEGRVSSKRKDDTRVHVDAFPATPVQGLRILRIFTNINPYAEPRVWHVGEPFSDVLKRFSADIPKYKRSIALFLKAIRVTKSLRTAYDHFMLHLHDAMKLDDDYQQSLEKKQIDFPANTSWVVFTDQVSHAALKGQFLLEQTFYLPIEAMVDPSMSPFSQVTASCQNT